MEGEHIQEINNINEQIKQMKADHELQVQRLEASYNEKLIIEYNKFMSYEAKTLQMIKEWEIRYSELQHDKEESEHSIKEHYQEIIKEKDLQYEEVTSSEIT